MLNWQWEILLMEEIVIGQILRLSDIPLLVSLQEGKYLGDLFYIYILFFSQFYFFPFYSKRQQVYIDWHPSDDQLGSIWWQGTGDEKGGYVRRGKIWNGKRDEIETAIRAQYNADKAAGLLNDLPEV